jgi:hypothetical protein
VVADRRLNAFNVRRQIRGDVSLQAGCHAGCGFDGDDASLRCVARQEECLKPDVRSDVDTNGILVDELLAEGLEFRLEVIAQAFEINVVG